MPASKVIFRARTDSHNDSHLVIDIGPTDSVKKTCCYVNIRRRRAVTGTLRLTFGTGSFDDVMDGALSPQLLLPLP